MVTANFFNAPLPLVCYQNFHKAVPADLSGLYDLIFFYLVVLSAGLVLFLYR